MNFIKQLSSAIILGCILGTTICFTVFNTFHLKFNLSTALGTLILAGAFALVTRNTHE